MYVLMHACQYLCTYVFMHKCMREIRPTRPSYDVCKTRLLLLITLSIHDVCTSRALCSEYDGVYNTGLKSMVFF